jgi:hypothetical protein
VPKPHPDALLASKQKPTGTGCSFARMRSRLPADLDDAITRWLASDPTITKSAAIADTISCFAEVYDLDFSTNTTDQTVCRHRPGSEFGRKCKTCRVP